MSGSEKTKSEQTPWTIAFGVMFWIIGPIGTFYFAGRDIPVTAFDLELAIFFSLFWALPMALGALALFLCVGCGIGVFALACVFDIDRNNPSMLMKIIGTAIGSLGLIFVLPLAFRFFLAGLDGVFQGLF